jgi:hypothetical protein
MIYFDGVFDYSDRAKNKWKISLCFRIFQQEKNTESTKDLENSILDYSFEACDIHLLLS